MHHRPLETAGRGLALLLLLGILAVAYLLWWCAHSHTLAAALCCTESASTMICRRHVDDLPRDTRHYLARLLGASPGVTHIPLSKRFKYKLDTWFSTEPWCKPLCLLWATLAVIFLGSLGIYIVSGSSSLYNAIWQVC